MVGAFSEGLRGILFKIFSGVLAEDAEKITDAFIALDAINGRDKRRIIAGKIREFLNSWQTGSVIEMTTVEAFFRLIMISFQSRIDLPLPLVIIGKTLLEYDGDLRMIEPRMDIMAAFRPYAMKNIMFGAAAENRNVFSAHDFMDILRRMGFGFTDILKNAADNGIDFMVHFGPHTKAHRA